MPKSPIAAVIPIPKGIASEGSGEEPKKAALEAISQIAAGVDAKPKPRAPSDGRQNGDDPNGFLTFF